MRNLYIIMVMAAGCCFWLAGCAQTRSYSSASAAVFIEPVKDSLRSGEKTSLQLPARVALIMIPANQSFNRPVPETVLRKAAEQLKQRLLAGTRYVSAVDVVVKGDISSKVSLDDIRSMYGADIALIISYQQDQITAQSGPGGLADATILGMFVVPGLEVRTLSFVDGKVVHIPSSSIVFRASGTNERSAMSTSYAQNSSLKDESIEGFMAAMTDLGSGLTSALSRFEKFDLATAARLPAASADGGSDTGRAMPANDYWKKVDSYKSTGGGAFNVITLLAAVTACAAFRPRG